MLNLFNAQIENISIHRVGNKCRNEEIFLSSSPYRLTDEITPLLKEYFFKPFRDAPEDYLKFEHDVDLKHHELYQIIYETIGFILDGDETYESQIHNQTIKIAQHLYAQSNHPHIKAGEVYVLYISGITLDNKHVDAIGIFKSEIKKDFLQIIEESGNSHLDLLLQQGISLEKIDKGCLIFDTCTDDGYKIMSIDNNKYDARYWLEHFLQVSHCEDGNFLTKKYLKFVQDFSKDVILPATDKLEQVLFENRAVNYFGKNDVFEQGAFESEVIDDDELIAEFQNYKVEKGPKYSIEDVSSFPISNTAVKDMNAKFKGTIDLDTNITICTDFINPESAARFIEKGWDEEKQMYYYLVYFNKEQKA